MPKLDYSFLDDPSDKPAASLDYSFLSEPEDQAEPSPYTEDGSQLPEARSIEPTFLDSIQDFFTGGERHRARASNELAAREIAEREGVEVAEVYESVRGSRPLLNPEGRAPFRALSEGAGIVGSQFASTDIPLGVVNTIGRTIRGGDDDVDDSSWIDRVIESSDVAPNPDADPNYQPFQNLGKNLGYSLTTMASGIAAYAAGSAVGTPLTGTVAAGAASGAVAFRGSKDEFLSRAREVTDAYFEEVHDRKMNQQEWDQVYNDFNAAANKYGAWEAIPEAVGNMVFIRAFALPLKGATGSKLAQFKQKAYEVAGRTAQTLATENVTEIATALGQNVTERDVGLTDRELSLRGAIQETVVPTTLLTTIMGGAGAAGKALAGKLKPKFDQDSIIPDLFSPTHKAGGGQDVQPVTKNGKIVPETYVNANGDIIRDANAIEVAPYDQSLDINATVGAVKQEIEQGKAGVAAARKESFPTFLQADLARQQLGETNLQAVQDRDGSYTLLPPLLADVVRIQNEQDRVKQEEGRFDESNIVEEIDIQGLPEEQIDILAVPEVSEQIPDSIEEIDILPTADVEFDSGPVKGIVNIEMSGGAVAASDEISVAANEASTSPENALEEPTEAQKEAGNYKKGHTRVQGFDIAVENPAGSKRRAEWPTLKQHYGYIKRTVGADSKPGAAPHEIEQVDVFVKPDTDIAAENPIFIIDQATEDGKTFDEHKVMMGFDSEQEAREAYLANYTKGWKGLKAITEATPEEFKTWLDEGNQAFEYAGSDTKAVVPGETAVEQAQIVGYHGTDTEFTAFSNNFISDFGHHVGTKEQAGRFGKIQKKVNAKINNPLRLDDLGTWDYQNVIREARKAGVDITEAEYDQVFNQADEAAATRSLLKEKGYDGIVYDNAVEGAGDSYIAFDASQISIETEADRTKLPSAGEERAAAKARLEKKKAGKLSKQDAARKRTKENLTPKPGTDDVITFIRKLGGIDVDTESDVRGRLSHLNQENRTFGLPGIEQKGGKGMSLDLLGERLIEAGYMLPDPNIGNGVDKDAVIELLSNAEGAKQFSLQNTAEIEAAAEARFEEEREADAEREAQDYAEYVRDNSEYTQVDPETARLLALALEVDEDAAVDIASKEAPESEIQAGLKQLIEESKRAKEPETSRGETTAPEADQRDQGEEAETEEESFGLTAETSAEQRLADLETEKDRRRSGIDQEEPAAATTGDDLFANQGQLEPDLFAEPQDAYADMRGKEISYEVEAEDTGQVYTLTIDAAEAMEKVDARIAALKQLRDCI